jgi:TRAP-type mannitol/chloroaromatic compound transport system permease large subunit
MQEDIYGGTLQFMCMQVVDLALFINFPEIALWLPSVLYPE